MDFSKLVVPEDLSFGVDDSITLDERELQIPLNLSEVGVTNDNKVERLNFKVPAVFDGVNDLSTFTWWVNYVNAAGQENLYHVDDLKKVGDYLTFSWLTNENLYVKSGDVYFSLRAIHPDGRAFGTKVAVLRVAEGLNTASTIYEHDYDFINQYFAELDGMKKEVETGVSQIEGVKADAESARISENSAKSNAEKAKASADLSTMNSELSLKASIKKNVNGNPVCFVDSIDYKFSRLKIKSTALARMKNISNCGTNLLNIDTIVENKGISTSSGGFYSDPNKFSTDFIYVGGVKKIYDNSEWVCGYDENKNYVKTIKGGHIDENTVYIRATFNNEKKGNAFISLMSKEEHLPHIGTTYQFSKEYILNVGDSIENVNGIWNHITLQGKTPLEDADQLILNSLKTYYKGTSLISDKDIYFELEYLKNADVDNVLSDDSLSFVESGVIKKYIDDNNMLKYDLRNEDYLKGWIEHETGKIKKSDNTRSFQFLAKGISKIVAHFADEYYTMNAISFYATENISSESYMKNQSVAFRSEENGSKSVYKVDVPKEAKLIVITTRNLTSEYEPLLLFDNASFIKQNFDEIKNLSDRTSFSFPFLYKKCFGHLLVNQVTSPFSSEIVIPCQSIYDVQMQSRLGFTFIEANVHRTLDEKYVVTHGIQGKLGRDFETINGVQCDDVVIGDKSFDELRTNYRYRSVYPKYKVPITSLEEFLYECKKYGMYPILQYVDNQELEIAKGIVGNDICLGIYGGHRPLGWKGLVSEFCTFKTKQEILEHCVKVGKPYIYSMGNPNDFTDEAMKEIVAELHKNGFYIGIVEGYTEYRNIERAENFGFDCIAVTNSKVNLFENGNLINLTGDSDFNEILDKTTSGSVESGTLLLNKGGHIDFYVPKHFLTKYSCELVFKGKIKYINDVFESKEKPKSLLLTGYSIDKLYNFKIIAEESTEIYSIVFKASKC